VPSGVRATHDQSQSRERGLALESEDPKHGVERAAFADMAQFDILDVEWNAAAFTRHVDHLIRIDEKDSRLRIKKVAGQTGAGDAVHFWPPARLPNTWPPRAQPFNVAFHHEGQTCFSPALIAAVQTACVDSLGAQWGDRALAHFVAGFPGDRNRARRVELVHPLASFPRIAPDGAWQ